MDGVGWTAMVWAAQIRNVSRSLWLISLQAHPGCHTCPHSVQFSHFVVSDSRNPMDHSTSITNSRSLLKLMSIESVMPSSRLILCRPLLPPSVY